MFLYTSHWYCLSKWCFNTNTQLLLLFYHCQNFVSNVINGEMWADVALTVCFLHWAAWQARVTSAFSEYLILSLFHPVWHSSVGCWGHCGWAGAVQEIWKTTAAQSCAVSSHHQSAPGTSGTSLTSWRALGKLTFPATDGPCKLWLCLSQIFPGVCHSTKNPELLHHCGFSFSCSLIKTMINLAAKIRWMRVCSLWDVWNFRWRIFLVRWRCFRAYCCMVEFGQESHPDSS